MKMTKPIIAAVLILLGFGASDAALARPFGHHGGGVRLSLAVGVPIGLGYGYYGGYYAPPYYSSYYSPYYSPYYPSAVVAPYAAPTYIEQGGPQSAPQAAPASQNYWYYCADTKSYYPYVSQCSGGWQRVSPTPPSG